MNTYKDWVLFVDNIFVDAKEIEEDLVLRYGTILSGESLKNALGFSSMFALKQAITRNKIPVPLFKLENRRGRFALTKDVAAYLSKKRNNVLEESNK